MKIKHKYIGLVCQNETLFQNFFNMIYNNLNKQNDNIVYHLVTFNISCKTKYDYIIFIESYVGFNLNNLRYTIYNSDAILLLNNDIGETNAFSNCLRVLTYGCDSNSNYLINNVSINSTLIIFDLYHNNQTDSIYFVSKKEEDIYYILPIIILFLIEKYTLDDITMSLQKIK